MLPEKHDKHVLFLWAGKLIIHKVQLVINFRLFKNLNDAPNIIPSVGSCNVFGCVGVNLCNGVKSSVDPYQVVWLCDSH